MKYISTILALLICVTVACSQSGDFGKNEFNLYRPEVVSIRSQYVKDMEYKLHITLPPTDNNMPDKKYPVLYYLDAWGCTGMITDLARVLISTKGIEPIILVGISFDANVEKFLKLRNRDFLPNTSSADSLSGADDFLNFIKKELIPFIESNYPADNKERGLFGYSFGGLFAAWVLKKEPLLFNKWGMGSPSLWYGESFLLKDKELLDNIKNARNISVITTYGSLEHKSIKSSTDVFYGYLKTNGTIRKSKVVFAGETHVSAYAATCSRVLTFFYKM